MPLDIVTVPCRTDNYAYLLHDRASGQTALVDAPEAAPLLEALTLRGWTLHQVFLTHHHPDHVEGLPGLRAAFPDLRVLGATACAHRLPPLDQALAEGDTVQVGGDTGHVLDVSGHTLGHIAFHFPGSRAAFTADSLMALGCGRLFEGTPAQMWDSLSKLAALPPDTLICSGHEYTQSNARFALTIDPGNAALHDRAAQIEDARARGLPTVPSLLSVELQTNPFLRAADAAVQAQLGMSGAAPVDVFTEIRARKDRF